MIRVGLIAVACAGCGSSAPTVDPTATIVPLETSDRAALVQLSDWRALPTLGDGRFAQAASTDHGTTPPPAFPYPLFSNGNRDFNNFLCASDDAEIGKPVVVEPVLALPACPDSYVRGFAIARFEGSGMLARIWLTTFNWRTAAPSEEILRIYIDDEPIPMVQVPLADVVAGTNELFAAPFGASAPSYLATYYPIVFATKLVVAIDRIQPIDVVFHQVDVVLDPVPTSRQAADEPLAERDAAAATLRALQDGVVTGTGLLSPTSFTIAPSGSRVVAQLAGPATIHTLRLQIPATALAQANDVTVEARWDGAAPAIALPLAALFGAMRDAPTDASLALRGRRSADDVVLELRLPMPFASSAEWTLRNTSTQPITLTMSIDGEAALPAEPWGTLHTQMHETVSPATAAHPLVNVTGRGRLVGICAALEGHALAAGGLSAAALNFLEGDERATIDGVLALEGTGTEDYFDSAFYFQHGTRVTAFAQAWAIDGAEVGATLGHASACRWHVGTNAIDFQTAIDMELEIGPADPSALDRYRSVAFYYQ